MKPARAVIIYMSTSRCAVSWKYCICVQEMYNTRTAMPCIVTAHAVLFVMFLQCVRLIMICEQYEVLQFTCIVSDAIKKTPK